ncbi:hypothetical protein VULLAG_LOCUS11432 [Vulpes lagopus]
MREDKQGDEPEIYGIMRGAKSIYPQAESVESGHRLVYKCSTNSCVEGEDCVLAGSYILIQGNVLGEKEGRKKAGCYLLGHRGQASRSD